MWQGLRLNIGRERLAADQVRVVLNVTNTGTERDVALGVGADLFVQGRDGSLAAAYLGDDGLYGVLINDSFYMPATAPSSFGTVFGGPKGSYLTSLWEGVTQPAVLDAFGAAWSRRMGVDETVTFELLFGLGSPAGISVPSALPTLCPGAVSVVPWSGATFNVLLEGSSTAWGSGGYQTRIKVDGVSRGSLNQEVTYQSVTALVSWEQISCTEAVVTYLVNNMNMFPAEVGLGIGADMLVGGQDTPTVSWVGDVGMEQGLVFGGVLSMSSLDGGFSSLWVGSSSADWFVGSSRDASGSYMRASWTVQVAAMGSFVRRVRWATAPLSTIDPQLFPSVPPPQTPTPTGCPVGIAVGLQGSGFQVRFDGLVVTRQEGWELRMRVAGSEVRMAAGVVRGQGLRVVPSVTNRGCDEAVLDFEIANQGILPKTVDLGFFADLYMDQAVDLPEVWFVEGDPGVVGVGISRKLWVSAEGGGNFSGVGVRPWGQAPSALWQNTLPRPENADALALWWGGVTLSGGDSIVLSALLSKQPLVIVPTRPASATASPSLEPGPHLIGSIADKTSFTCNVRLNDVDLPEAHKKTTSGDNRYNSVSLIRRCVPAPKPNCSPLPASHINWVRTRRSDRPSTVACRRLTTPLPCPIPPARRAPLPNRPSAPAVPNSPRKAGSPAEPAVGPCCAQLPTRALLANIDPHGPGKPQQRQPAETASRDSRQGPPAGTALRDGQQRQPAETASRDGQH